MDDKEAWARSFKNKGLCENFEVKPGGKPLPAKPQFKKEEEKEITRKLKTLEKRIEQLEKQCKQLTHDNIIFKRKLKHISDRNINEATDTEE